MKKISLLVILFVLLSACSLPFLGGGNQGDTPAVQPSDSGPGPAVGAPEDPTSEPRPTLSPGDVEDVTSGIQQQVISLRGLQPKTADLKQDTLTPEELNNNVKNDFFKDYTPEDAEADVRELAAFGLLPPGFDLIKMYIDLYSEQVAGYYDPETKDMYVVQGEDFKGTEKMTYAHEYTHVLQDQNWDLENGLKSNDEYCKTHTEYCAGVQALIEGDASLTELNWFYSAASEQDQQDIQDFYSDYTSPVLDSTPLFMQRDLYFPYEQGLNFVQYLYDGGGWEAVDKAYANPPSSTEMILHPEKYPSDPPVDVPLKDVTSALGSGWEESTRNTMGEWYFNLVLAAGEKESARLNEDTAAAAAAGWAGDTYTVNWNESTGQLAMILRSRWETTRDADEFWNALTDYGAHRWGESSVKSGQEIAWSGTADQFVKFFRDGQDIWWVIAPDQATADRAANAAK